MEINAPLGNSSRPPCHRPLVLLVVSLYLHNDNNLLVYSIVLVSVWLVRISGRVIEHLR